MLCENYNYNNKQQTKKILHFERQTLVKNIFLNNNRKYSSKSHQILMFLFTSVSGCILIQSLSSDNCKSLTMNEFTGDAGGKTLVSFVDVSPVKIRKSVMTYYKSWI